MIAIFGYDRPLMYVCSKRKLFELVGFWWRKNYDEPVGLWTFDSSPINLIIFSFKMWSRDVSLKPLALLYLGSPNIVEPK